MSGCSVNPSPEPQFLCLENGGNDCYLPWVVTRIKCLGILYTSSPRVNCGNNILKLTIYNLIINNNVNRPLFKLICFWPHWVFVAAHGLSLVVESWLLIAVTSLVAERRLQRAHRLPWLRLAGHRAQALAVPLLLGLCCLKVCGIIPNQGSNWCSPPWQANS